MIIKFKENLTFYKIGLKENLRQTNRFYVVKP